MSTIFAILLATFFISVLSLSGIVLLGLKEKLIRKLSIFLVAFAAGALMGAAFLHLLPEAVKELPQGNPFIFILFGFIIFFIIEKVLHWHHSHNEQESHSNLGVLSLTGDFLHNFLDGILLAAAFLVDVKLGFVTAAAVALHEIPQEISEFGILLYAGFSKKKALLLNFLSATSVVAGGIVGYFLVGSIEHAIPFIILVTVGTFLYLAASDFVPEIRKEEGFVKSLKIFLAFGGGIALMWLFAVLG